MKIKVVNVLLQIEVADADPNDAVRLELFIEKKEEDLDEPLYEAANDIVRSVLRNAKEFNIPMKDDGKAPAHDFDIERHYKVVVKP